MNTYVLLSAIIFISCVLLLSVSREKYLADYDKLRFCACRPEQNPKM